MSGGANGTILRYGQTSQLPVYRFWSNTQQTHVYTIDEGEKNFILSQYDRQTWRYEKLAWFAFKEGEQPEAASPVYRFWSDEKKSHFFTISEDEKDFVIANYPEHQWLYEGVAYYAYKPMAAPEGTQPVYRFWSDERQRHFYTIDEQEKEWLINGSENQQWRYEGVNFYAYPVR